MAAATFLPIQVSKALENVNFERFLINMYGTYRLAKNLITNPHLLGWRDVPGETEDTSPSSLSNDIYNIASLPVNYLREKYEDWRERTFASAHERHIGGHDLYYD